MGSGQKICPVLKKLGIKQDANDEGCSVCQLCTLPECILVKPGRLSWNDEQELNRIARALEKFKEECLNLSGQGHPLNYQ